jgi:hypothetical protein
MRKRIKVEVQEGRSKNILAMEASSFSDAKEQLLDFLTYVFRGETGGEEAYDSEFKPEYVPSWVGEHDLRNLSQKDKVYLLLKKNHPVEWVKSQHIQAEYEEVYGETIKLSSLSTYLSRFYEHGALDRRGSRAQREYKLLEA